MRMAAFLILGLSALGCSSNSFLPAGDVQGTWAADFGIPGAALVLDLSQSEAAVTGTGTYAIEAGRSGTLHAVGTYARPAISLSIAYDYGRTETFAGAVLDSQHMTGTVSDSAGHTSALSFTRR